jgi:aryl-alcohol dehydrogenase-like predicted oxidoreductase
MQYRRLGKSNLTVSVIGMGCIQFGDKADLRETERIVGRALELGITYFDTANVYSDGVGEEFLGKALGSRRKDIVLATKVGRVRMGTRRKLVRDSSPAEIRAGIDASLRRLGTDYIDLFQVHWPDPDVSFEDTMAAMQELVTAGKVRHVGICNYAGEQVRRAHAAMPALATLQSPYNMFRRDLETETFPYCVHHGIGIIPYWPLEQGVLAGRYTPESVPENAPPALRAQVQVVARLRPIAERLGRPIAQLALAWLLARPGVASVIPGASRHEQLAENVGVGDWNLTPTEVQEIDIVLAGPG